MEAIIPVVNLRNIKNLITIFGTADYKGLFIDLFIPGSQVYIDNECILATTEEYYNGLHPDAIELTEEEYSLKRGEIEARFRAEAQTSENRIASLESQNTQMLQILSISQPIANPTEIQDYQTNKILELNTACNNEILGGFSSSATGAVHQYKFDMEYQANMAQEGMMLALDSTITAVDWPTVDAGVVTHSRDQFIQLCKDSKTIKETKLYRYFNLKAQVLAATTIDAVNAFLW